MSPARWPAPIGFVAALAAGCGASDPPPAVLTAASIEAAIEDSTGERPVVLGRTGAFAGVLADISHVADFDRPTSSDEVLDVLGVDAMLLGRVVAAEPGASRGYGEDSGRYELVTAYLTVVPTRVAGAVEPRSDGTVLVEIAMDRGCTSSCLAAAFDPDQELLLLGDHVPRWGDVVTEVRLGDGQVEPATYRVSHPMGVLQETPAGLDLPTAADARMPADLVGSSIADAADLLADVLERRS